MTDDSGLLLKEGSSSPSGIGLPEVSRRTFIKLLGLVVVETAVAGQLLERAALGGSPHLSFAAAQLPSPAARLLQQAFDELRSQGFPFNPDQSSVIMLPNKPHILGMLFQDTRLPPYPDGADVALTVDLNAPERSHLHYVIGRSRPDALELQSTQLSAGGRRQEQRERYARLSTSTRTGAAICPSKHTTLCGEPADTAHGSAEQCEHTQWYYNHCDQALWCRMSSRSGGAQQLQLLYTSCEEFRNSRNFNPARPRRTRSWRSEIHQSDLGNDRA